MNSRVQMVVAKLSDENRMVRVGFGRNMYRWFARIDLWWFYIRLSTRPKKTPEWMKHQVWEARPDGLYQLPMHTAHPNARFAPGDRPKE